MERAAYINEAGLDGLEWLSTTDRVQSIVVYALAQRIHGMRAEAYKKAKEG